MNKLNKLDFKDESDVYYEKNTQPLTDYDSTSTMKIHLNPPSKTENLVSATTQLSVTPSSMDELNMITTYGTSNKPMLSKLSEFKETTPNQVTISLPGATHAPPIINTTVESTTLTVVLPTRISNESIKKQTRLTTTSSNNGPSILTLSSTPTLSVTSTFNDSTTTPKVNEYGVGNANPNSDSNNKSTFTISPFYNYTQQVEENSIKTTTKFEDMMNLTFTTDKFTSNVNLNHQTKNLTSENQLTTVGDSKKNSTSVIKSELGMSQTKPVEKLNQEVTKGQENIYDNKTTISDSQHLSTRHNITASTSSTKPMRQPTGHSSSTTKPPTPYRGSTPKMSYTKQRPKPTTSKRPSTTKITESSSQNSTSESQHIDEWANQIHQVTTQRPYVAKRDCGIRLMSDRESRVVGGRDSQLGEFPWSVLIRETALLGWFEKTKCGGVLIDLKWVLTAAHCQPGRFGALVVVMGEYDLAGGRLSSGQNLKLKPIVKRVKRMIVHRDYNPNNFDNDIALLELESPFQVQPHVVPICLPNKNEDFIGQSALVAGWGKLSFGGPVPNVLQVAKLPVIGNKQCEDMYQNSGHLKLISDSFLCAGYANGGQDSCEGDSGGPLQVLRKSDNRWVLVGTVSHGIKCAEPNLPGIYIRTAAYLPWIKSIIYHQDNNKRYGHRLASFSVEQQRSTPKDKFG